ncbi:glycosyl hydrolase family 76-domain-containing protein [Phyllosticta citribraziliensis]
MQSSKHSLTASGLAMALLLFLTPLTSAISLDTNDAASIKAAANTAAKGIISSYTFGAAGTAEYLVGTWPKPIYWWEAGAVWGGMVDYRAYTGDAQYNQLIQRAFEAQAGPENSFTRDEFRKEFGNDDQAFWALSALSAAEQSFPALANPSHGYATLAANVFSAQIARWDTTSCGGGLRWQVYPENKGYTYKNSVSNGALFQVAARLALFNNDVTGKYATWAAKLWDWSVGVGFVDQENQYAVYDGANVGTNCTDINLVQWTYNNALYLYGAAAMYNLTASTKSADAGMWKERVDALVAHAARSFFNRPGIPLEQHGDAMYEAACEPINMCNTDQMSFKAYLSRWLAKTTVIVPHTLEIIKPLITASAKGAADACTGPGELNCGFRWNTGNFDGMNGLGPQLAALEVFDALLLVNRQALTIKGGHDDFFLEHFVDFFVEQVDFFRLIVNLVFVLLFFKDFVFIIFEDEFEQPAVDIFIKSTQVYVCTDKRFSHNHRPDDVENVYRNGSRHVSSSHSHHEGHWRS